MTAVFMTASVVHLFYISIQGLRGGRQVRQVRQPAKPLRKFWRCLPGVTVRTPSKRGTADGTLIQAVITVGMTVNLTALRNKALSNVMNASSALLNVRCSASAKSMPCA